LYSVMYLKTYYWLFLLVLRNYEHLFLDLL